jgi:hypothetical protein
MNASDHGITLKLWRENNPIYVDFSRRQAQIFLPIELPTNWSELEVALGILAESEYTQDMLFGPGHAVFADFNLADVYIQTTIRWCDALLTNDDSLIQEDEMWVLPLYWNTAIGTVRMTKALCGWLLKIPIEIRESGPIND